MRILVAEDESSIARALKALLEKNKYTVDVVDNGTDALAYITSSPYDALVLDIMMPGMDGIQVLRAARTQGVATPALFLTAKSQVEDRVAGLDAGADDYLPKPFASAEFLARVRALTRRSSTYVPSVLTVGNVSLDCSQYDLSTPEGCIRLSNKEYQLMELFMRHPRQVFSSDHLMERIWQADSDAEIDVIWTYIGFLRKKLKQLNANVEIKTIRGAGYSLEG
ncbi:MAG: response regulator transcription factor [Candidatus Limiplasma sp.]|nr:response regulator transcription factor [Clostridiales bacterium]MDY3815962.1 response regulator transcription factor [Candidatus Limiplasma sp.]